MSENERPIALAPARATCVVRTFPALANALIVASLQWAMFFSMDGY
jgi:hypothetical protein